MQSQEHRHQGFWPRFAQLYLRIVGWQLAGIVPDIPKFVLIAAPHTSSWDVPVMLMVRLALGVRLSWMGKAELFRFPFGGFFRMLGGIPVYRSERNNMVQQMVDHFNNNEHLYLAVAPEGSRGYRDHWKSGFYHIARGANVPIVFGFIDYKRKTSGVGPMLLPTGDINADMAVIREFYEPLGALNPEMKGPIVLAEQKQTA
jgi:1-acyl-sn-glycerol-3-phosphate acyltransferase